MRQQPIKLADLQEAIRGRHEQALQQALTAKRQEWYGIFWELVDWHGIPVSDIPEPQRTELANWVRRAA